MKAEIITGDLLDSPTKYIAHQCNCISQNSAGVAKSIFNRFPFADTYQNRTEPDQLGSIKVLGNGIDQRFVINMFSQYYPGSPKYPDSATDGLKSRERHFHRCLLKISQIPNLETIAFPWKIGCNLAGGDWKFYLGTINNFAEYVDKHQQAKVIIFRREFD